MTDLWILGGCGCLLIGLGLFVWKKQAIYLLNNFPHDPNQLTDPKRLSRWAGILFILMGLSVFISVGIAYILRETEYEWLTIVSIAISILPLTVIYLIGGQRFIKK